MKSRARLRRVESVVRAFKGDSSEWLRMQPDAVLNALIARQLAGKTIARVPFPDDPSALDPKEIEAMLTDEVLQAATKCFEESSVY
jgi:hypothetical protein